MSSLKYSPNGPRKYRGSVLMQTLIREALMALQQQNQHLNLLGFPGCTVLEIQEYILSSHQDIKCSFEFERGLLTELGRGCVTRQWQALASGHDLVRYRAVPEEALAGIVRVYKRPSDGRLRGKVEETAKESDELSGAVNGLSLSSGAC